MAEEAVTLVVDNTEITAEVEVREGGMVKKTPPPPKPTRTDREWGATVRTVGMEVGRRIENGLIGGVGKMK